MSEIQNSPDKIQLETHRLAQFPLIVFFEMASLIALICALSDVTGLPAAIGLAAMTCSILFRLGGLALVSFALALTTVNIDSFLSGTIVCIGLGALIASWPMLHTVFQGSSETQY